MDKLLKFIDELTDVAKKNSMYTQYFEKYGIDKNYLLREDEDKIHDKIREIKTIPEEDVFGFNYTFFQIMLREILYLRSQMRIRNLEKEIIKMKEEIKILRSEPGNIDSILAKKDYESGFKKSNITVWDGRYVLIDVWNILNEN